MRVPPRVMPALVTPFRRNGGLDLNAHQHNLELLWRREVRGFVIGGSNGEGPYLETGDRARLLETARSELGGRAFLICGVVAESMRTALAQADEAAGAGADALLVLTPTSLIRGRDDAVAGFYLDLADQAPLPILLYSVPMVTGYELAPAAFERAVAHPNIAGIKDSGGHPVRIAALADLAPPGFALYVGASPAVALSVAAGARGAITGSVNYATGLVRETVARAVRSVSRAAATQERLTRLSLTVDRHGIPGVKVAAAAAGLRPGYPRRPLRLPSGPASRALRGGLESLAGDLG
ncbi:MAG: dihydrodipicolinate synthase family protein [Acidimicrobiia bacterium]